MHLLKLWFFVELSFSWLEAAKAANVGMPVPMLTGFDWKQTTRLDELWPFTDSYPVAVA